MRSSSDCLPSIRMDYMGTLRKICSFVSDHQNGLFKIALLLFMLYWSIIFKNIGNSMPNSAWIENSLENIDHSLEAINQNIDSILMNLNR
jgi:hypothetical protein